MKSTKYFDNRSEEFGESVTTTLSEQLKTFNQFSISDEIEGIATKSINNSSSTDDIEIDDANVKYNKSKNFESRGDRILLK